MNNTPLVSIIIPCYKQAHFLNETLESVFKQTYLNWECIIVNDGSPDNTDEIAKLWLQKDNRFLYISKLNGGLCSARNAGVIKSKGNYILPLDSDDILHEEYLKIILPVLLNKPALGIVSCYMNYFKDDINNVYFQKYIKGSSLKDLKYENILMASSLYRKECWDQVGGYDEQMKKGFEDWEFWINITKRGWEFEIIEKPLFFYRKSENSMLINTLKNHVESNIEYVFRKHKEIYIEDFETTLYYLFFLIKRHKTSEVKLKESIEYKIGKIITKPFRVLKKLFNIGT